MPCNSGDSRATGLGGGARWWGLVPLPGRRRRRDAHRITGGTPLRGASCRVTEQLGAQQTPLRRRRGGMRAGRCGRAVRQCLVPWFGHPGPLCATRFLQCVGRPPSCWSKRPYQRHRVLRFRRLHRPRRWYLPHLHRAGRGAVRGGRLARAATARAGLLRRLLRRAERRRPSWVRECFPSCHG